MRLLIHLNYSGYSLEEEGETNPIVNMLGIIYALLTPSFSTSLTLGQSLEVGYAETSWKEVTLRSSSNPGWS